MASLDSLPPDQRAVLQLVLQRGKSYDEIARLLSIDRAAVRERALTGLDALGPGTVVPPERRALITDYLLGQLPPQVSDNVRDRLAQSPRERVWARVVASELAPIAAKPLPEIPVESVTREPRQPVAAPAAPTATMEPTLPRDDGEREGASPPPRPSSRRGGAIVLAIGGALVAVAVVVVIVLVVGTSSSTKHSANTTGAAAAPTVVTVPSTTSTQTSTPQVAAQVNLVSPTAPKKTAGVALVVRQGANAGIVLRAIGLPANTKHDAYAVWLYNSPTDSLRLGFVSPGVKADGKLQAAAPLPANASRFKQLLLTLETQAAPHGPGPTVLKGVLKLQ